jgi:hypothetical protein
MSAFAKTFYYLGLNVEQTVSVLLAAKVGPTFIWFALHLQLGSWKEQFVTSQCTPDIWSLFCTLFAILLTFSPILFAISILNKSPLIQLKAKINCF